jgi:hypothetical protein
MMKTTWTKLFNKERWYVPTISGMLVALLILVCLIVDISYTYQLVWNRFAPKAFLVGLTGESYETQEISLSDGNEIVQSYRGTKDGIGSGKIELNASGMKENAVVHFFVEDEANGEVLYQKDYAPKDLKSGLNYELEEDARNIAGHTIGLKITTDGVEEEDGVVISVIEDAYADGELQTNGSKTSYDMAFVIYPVSYKMKTIKTLYLVVMTAMCLLAVYVYAMTRKKDLKLERDIFLPASLVIGLVYMFMLAPFTIPDEGTHFLSSYSLSNKMLGIDDETVVRQEDRFDVYGDTMDSYTYSYVSSVLFQKAQGTENTAINPVKGEYLTGPILMYGPAACGITLARLMRLGYTDLIFWGRFFNLLFTTVCIYWAIKWMPYRKEMLLVISMLPMVFQQRASYSYDGPVIGLIFLATAYL